MFFEFFCSLFVANIIKHMNCVAILGTTLPYNVWMLLLYLYGKHYYSLLPENIVLLKLNEISCKKFLVTIVKHKIKKKFSICVKHLKDKACNRIHSIVFSLNRHYSFVVLRVCNA